VFIIQFKNLFDNVNDITLTWRWCSSIGRGAGLVIEILC